ncbi:MAG: MBL fold metallo-hydrolase [Paludibacteraceae bacterium]|nr:MBL fold metallo-hydrolase [Paludibacteraceae bacterium]
MKVTFLGTGTSSGVPFIGCSCKVCKSTDPRDHRLRCSSLLEVDGVKILIDCGPDFRQQALANGLTHIDALLLTHEHIDHMMGIDDLRPFGNVDVYVSELTAKALRRVYSYCFNNDYPGIPSLSLHEIDDRPFSVKGVEIVPVRALHYCLPVFGYRIGNFGYLTDLKSIADEELEKLMGLDVFVVDALRPKKHLSHPSIEEALAIVEKIKPKKTYFVHMSHDFGLHAEQENQLPAGVHVAYDGLSIEF